MEGADIENDVKVVVNCYDVVSPISDCGKRDMSECCFVEEEVFSVISGMELLCVRHGNIACYLRTHFQVHQYHIVSNITVC